MQPTPHQQKIFEHNYKTMMRWPSSYRNQCLGKTDGGLFAPAQIDYDSKRPR